jgi:pimeloyl-ACP methyl ester carboxylesterase
MSQEGAIMVPTAAALRRHYGGFSCPSIVMTGDADRVVDPEDQSIRLAHELNLSVLRIIPGAGHMVHHAVPLEVAEAINQVASSRARVQEVA